MAKTTLVTGVSGFIAKHIVLKLLAAGHAVRGTVRDLAAGEAVKLALQRGGADPSALDLVRADLEDDDDAGWTSAVRDVDYVMHVAAPFPLQQPRGRLDLVPAAQGGTLGVLCAVQSAGTAVQRVVVTSSLAAMMYRVNRSRVVPVREEDWTDPDWPPASPYIVAKTLAERTAWEWAEETGFTKKMVAINPGFVLGPALDTKAATSLAVIKLIFSGAYPAVPRVHFSVVDVRDLADLHAAALTAPDVGGRRLIGAAGSLSMAQIAGILKQEFPERGRKIPTKTLPVVAVKLLALFDQSLRTILADLNVIPQPENDYVTKLTGVRFRAPQESVIAAGQSLVDLGDV